MAGIELAALPSPVSTGPPSPSIISGLRRDPPSAARRRIRFQGFLSIPARAFARDFTSLWGYPWRPSGIIPADHTIMLPMRNVLLISCLLAGVVVVGCSRPGAGRTARRKSPLLLPAHPPHRRPRKPTPHLHRGDAAPAATRSGMAITVTTPQGATISGVHVSLMGPTERGGDTDGSGQVNFPGLQAGTYRLRFSGDRSPRSRRKWSSARDRSPTWTSHSVLPLSPKVVTAPAPAPAPAATAPRRQSVPRASR